MTPLQIFRRFLRFGFLAFGGPVAQIGLLRKELVDEERWIEPERFRRILGVYQALPGPEAHELCVYFGRLKGGLVGGALAGLGFMSPGLVLMLGLAIAYEELLSGTPALEAISRGVAPVVVVLVARGAFRIARGSLRRPWLVAAAIVAAVLAAQGDAFAATSSPSAVPPSTLGLFLIGLQGGMLTFGGAYTAIPFVRALAVGPAGFMSEAAFLDGLAIGSIIPAPLVIFVTFVGYQGGGVSGALAATAGMFLPAFAFTLIGGRVIERIVEEPRVHGFLDGVTAAVVGIVAVTAAGLAADALRDGLDLVVAVAALALVVAWRRAAAVPVAVVGGGLVGLLVR